MNAPTVGHWWLTYDDGAVWPCEVLRPSIAGQWVVCPLPPAPDAGAERVEPRGRIYDSAFNHPAAQAARRAST